MFECNVCKKILKSKYSLDKHKKSKVCKKVADENKKDNNIIPVSTDTKIINEIVVNTTTDISNDIITENETKLNEDNEILTDIKNTVDTLMEKEKYDKNKMKIEHHMCSCCNKTCINSSELEDFFKSYDKEQHEHYKYVLVKIMSLVFQETKEKIIEITEMYEKKLEEYINK